MVGRGRRYALQPSLFYVLLVLLTLGFVTALGTGYVLERREMRGVLPSTQHVASKEAVPPPPPSLFEPLSTYDVIFLQDLFGTAAARRALEAEKKELDVSAIPLAAKSLKIVLKGTAIGEDGVGRVAVIEDQQTRKQGLYREGDRIRSALIKSILRNNVVINTGVRDEVLTIDPEQRSIGPGSPLRAGNEGSRTGAEATALSRAFLDRALEDIEGTLGNVIVRPQRLPDGTTGFRVSKIRSESLFSRLGLRNNDVVTEVNGSALESLRGLLDTMLVLEVGEELEVSVRRGSRPMAFKYRIE